LWGGFWQGAGSPWFLWIRTVRFLGLSALISRRNPNTTRDRLSRVSETWPTRSSQCSFNNPLSLKVYCGHFTPKSLQSKTLIHAGYFLKSSTVTAYFIERLRHLFLTYRILLVSSNQT